VKLLERIRSRLTPPPPPVCSCTPPRQVHTLTLRYCKGREEKHLVDAVTAHDILIRIEEFRRARRYDPIEFTDYYLLPQRIWPFQIEYSWGVS
jgi:hypothetical protein